MLFLDNYLRFFQVQIAATFFGHLLLRQPRTPQAHLPECDLSGALAWKVASPTSCSVVSLSKSLATISKDIKMSTHLSRSFLRKTKRNATQAMIMPQNIPRNLGRPFQDPRSLYPGASKASLSIAGDRHSQRCTPSQRGGQQCERHNACWCDTVAMLRSF